MQLEDTKFSIGGLLRCCTSGFEGWSDETEVTPGQHIPCKYHDDGGVTLRSDGVWVAAWVYERDGDVEAAQS